MARVEDSDSGRVCADGSWAFPAPGAQEPAENQESADGRWDIPAPGTQDVMPAEESASGSVRQAEVTRLSGAGRALAVGLRLAGGDVAKDAAHGRVEGRAQPDDRILPGELHAVQRVWQIW